MSRRRPLSEHFRPWEFDCRDGTRYPPDTRRQIAALCRDYLEPLRDRWGPVTILSGYRTKTYNARVGGAPNSRHVYRAKVVGVAVDLRCDRGTPDDWYRTLDELAVPGLGRYPGHVHADNRAVRARW